MRVFSLLLNRNSHKNSYNKNPLIAYSNIRLIIINWLCRRIFRNLNDALMISSGVLADCKWACIWIVLTKNIDLISYFICIYNPIKSKWKRKRMKTTITVCVYTIITAIRRPYLGKCSSSRRSIMQKLYGSVVRFACTHDEFQIGLLHWKNLFALLMIFDGSLTDLRWWSEIAYFNRIICILYKSDALDIIQSTHTLSLSLPLLNVHTLWQKCTGSHAGIVMRIDTVIFIRDSSLTTVVVNLLISEVFSLGSNHWVPTWSDH